MSPVRIGVAWEGEELVAVRLRKRGAPLVVSERLQAGEALGPPLSRLLDLLGAVSKRTVIGAVVGNQQVRTGRLFGISPAATELEVRAELASEPTSFFVGQRGSVVAGSVWKDGASWYGIVAERDVAETFLQAAEARHCDLSGLAPWMGFASLVAAAVHAAGLSPESAVLVDVLGADRLARARKKAKARALFGGGVMAVLIGFTPVLSATHAEREAVSLVERARETHATATSRVAALGGQAPLLGVLAEAASSRSRAVQFLEALARSLPDSSAVLWLDWSHGAAQAELVAADGADLVAALARDSTLHGLAIVGSIARQTVNGQQHDRVRVSWKAPQSAAEVRGAR